MKSHTSATLADSPVATRRPSRHWIPWTLLGLALALVCFFQWGGYLLAHSDPLPAHVDAAVVLQGSLRGERARIAGAMELLRQGKADRMLLSVAQESYWGEPVPPAARRFFEKNYETSLANKIDFCETNIDVDSTEDEAGALLQCVKEHGWKTVAVVTSNYHTRRAGMIWRKIVSKAAPSLQLWIYGVNDPEYREKRWWSERTSAKTWFLEFTKLIWTSVTG
jgi:uncharacterized SAM-binding protein YcdF (DUF218 family)